MGYWSGQLSGWGLAWATDWLLAGPAVGQHDEGGLGAEVVIGLWPDVVVAAAHVVPDVNASGGAARGSGEQPEDQQQVHRLPVRHPGPGRVLPPVPIEAGQAEPGSSLG